jgi:hypothetical protein
MEFPKRFTNNSKIKYQAEICQPLKDILVQEIDPYGALQKYAIWFV